MQTPVVATQTWKETDITHIYHPAGICIFYQIHLDDIICKQNQGYSLIAEISLRFFPYLVCVAF